MILDGWTIYGNTHHLELVPEARYWSCERQILEPLVTATGATNDSPCQSIAKRNHRSNRYWSFERQILEPLEPQILELRATDTGAASDRYWSRERQILELRATDTGASGATDTGAASNRYWSRERQPLEPTTTATAVDRH